MIFMNEGVIFIGENMRHCSSTPIVRVPHLNPHSRIRVCENRVYVLEIHNNKKLILGVLLY